MIVIDSSYFQNIDRWAYRFPLNCWTFRLRVLDLIPSFRTPRGNLSGTASTSRFRRSSLDPFQALGTRSHAVPHRDHYRSGWQRANVADRVLFCSRKAGPFSIWTDSILRLRRANHEGSADTSVSIAHQDTLSHVHSKLRDFARVAPSGGSPHSRGQKVMMLTGGGLLEVAFWSFR
jgi:hypothetical protein